MSPARYQEAVPSGLLPAWWLCCGTGTGSPEGPAGPCCVLACLWLAPRPAREPGTLYPTKLQTATHPEGEGGGRAGGASDLGWAPGGGRGGCPASSDWLPRSRDTQTAPARAQSCGDAVLQGCPPGTEEGMTQLAHGRRASQPGTCAAGGRGLGLRERLAGDPGGCRASLGEVLALRGRQPCLQGDCSKTSLGGWSLGTPGAHQELGQWPLQGRSSRAGDRPAPCQHSQAPSRRGSWRPPRPPSSVVSGGSWHPEWTDVA